MRKKFLLMIFVLSLFTSMGGGWLHAQTKNGVSSTSTETIFEDDFNDGNLDGWSLIDGNNDNKNWELDTEKGWVISKSYQIATYPQDYIVTESKYTLSESSVLSLRIGPAHESYNDNTYKVVISEDISKNISEWDIVLEENFRNSNNIQEIVEKTIDLSDDKNRTVYIGVYHSYGEEFDGTGVILDYIKLTGAAPAAEPVAKIGETPYTSFADALNAAKSMTGNVTVEIYEKVTMNQALAGSYNSINFVGKDTDAEIYLDVQGYTTATGKKVAFTDLKLSKSAGGFIANAGFMNVAFGIYDVAEVSYTNCTFLNGAYASSGKVTFNGCTFYRSHDKYGLWAYGNVDITVDGCTFADYRGIKMYAENGANASVEKPNLVVKNTDFSAVDNKPAIVLTYGESVVLEGNTYSSTGVFELDLDGKPNGVAVTSDVAPVCVNDKGACGVLVDGTIYTTVAQAAEVATSGSTVTLLHNSTETVKFPMGVTLEKNGFEANGVTVVVPVAQIGEVKYETFQAALKAIGSGDVVITLLKDVTMDITAWQTRAIGAANTTSITIDGENGDEDFTLTFNKLNSDWNHVATSNDNATKLILKNLQLADSGNNNGPWNRYDHNFACEVELTNVVSNKALAFKAGATLNNVTINETGDNYAIWIQPNGQDVDINGLKVESAGRGIKIDNQYVGDAQLVNLSVKNATFKTVKKAAIVVKSPAGANIVADNVDITNVEADSTNLVWVDEDGATDFGKVILTGGTVAQEGLEGFVAAISANDKVQAYYTSLQAAVNAVKDGETITLTDNVTGDVTLTEKVGLHYTIDGAGKTMNGAISVNSLSDTNDNRRITIKNINFKDTADANVDFISSVNTNHYPRLTIEGCTFTGSGNDGDVAVRLKSSHSVVIKDCTGTGLHSFLQNTSGWNLTIENVKVTDSKSGLALGTVQGVTVKGSDIDVAGYGIRLDAQYNNNAVIESNTVKAFIPVVVRKASVNSNIAVNGTNNLTATNSDGIWCAIGTSEYEENGKLPTDATGKVSVTLNDTELSYEGVYGNYYELAGEGTAENPYLINSVYDLKYFRDKVDEQAQDGSTQFAGKYFKLTADLDLAGINWNPIGSMSGDHGSFKGVFDGGNHTISNLNCEQAGNGLGLFARTAGNAEIKNLKLNNVTVKSTDNSNYVGGVVGNAYASTKINNVHVSGTINIAGRGYIGGIAGHGYVVMDNVSVVANEGSRSLITSTFWCAGGILGYAGEGSTNIMNANVEGITITSAAGGLGAIVGMAEDNEGTQPISGSNLSAKNVEIKTYVGAYGTYYEDYAIGYLYGGNPTSKLTGKLNVENVTLTNASGKTPAEVSDAVANVDGKIYFAFSNNEFKLLENGNNVTILRAGKYSIPTGKDLTITGAVNGVVFENIGAYGMGGANVTFNNVTFNYADNSTYKGLQHSGNLVYNNCTFNGQVFLYGASETFNNCTFNTTDSNNYNVWTYGAKNVAFNECTFNCAGKSVLIYNESPSVNNNVAVTNSQFIASQAVEGKAAIEMDSSLQGTINLTIDGETTATGFAAGNVSGNSLWNNKKDNNDITVVVNNETVLAPINGDGTEDNPYLINNVRELVAFRKSVNAGKTEFNAPGVYVALNADINLEGTTWEHGIGDGINATFDGIFDGRNNTIKNFTMEVSAPAGDYVCGGLFGYINGAATIKNLVIENATITATVNGGGQGHNVGVLVGFANNNGGKATIDNVTVKGDVKVDAPNVYGVGTIVGYSYRDMGTISNCTVDANEGSYIKGYSFVGGITGYSYSNAVISNCSVENLAITATSKGVGGIAGLALEGNNISGCTVANTTTVNGETNVAYIIGELGNSNGNVIIENCTAPQPWVGGAYATGEPFVATIGTKYYTSIKDAIKAVKDNETIVLIRDITMDYNARDSYETQVQNIVIDGNDHTLTLNQKNSDWASIGLANNSKLVLNNMTIEKTGYGDTSGAWNTHAIIFSCPLEMTKVTVNNGIAVQAGATLNNVTINEANGYYGLWINGNGQSVTMNGGSITATNGGRGIKIADQYIDAPAQVTLNVTGTDFNTAKKAAVLVSSKAGAQIVASNVDITDVEADDDNFVWVDEDWAANFGNVEVTGATVAQEGIENFVAAITKGANVEGYYKTLLAAVNAVQNGETITLIKDVTENVTLTEKTGLYYTIDGADKTMNGKIVITPLSDENDNRLITIKNINFVNTADAAVDFISSAVTNHYPRLTVEGCTFTGNGKNTDVALRLKTAYGAVIKDCTGKGLHSFLQNTAGKSLTIENVTVTESKSGFALGTVQGVTVKGCEIAVAGYGIRLDANTYNNNAVIENNKVTAFIPVVVRKVNTNSNITFQGANTMTATNTDGYWCVIGATEYEANGELPTAATGNVIVNLNDEGLSYEGVYGNYAVAKIGKVQYASLQAAIEDAQNGDTVILFANTDEVVSVNVLNKEISIVGEEDLFPVLTGGLDFGIDNHSQDAGNITIKGIKFVGNGIKIDDMASVTIEGNIFENITASNAIYVSADEYTTTLAITNNIITNVAGAGINLRNPINATVTGNAITNVTGNAMTFQNDSAIEDIAGEIVITGNVLTNWANGKTEGRAIRLALGNIADNVIIEENAMIAANAPEEFVKISGTSNAEISVDENYWNGVAPTAQHFLADGVQIHNYYASYDEANGLQNLVTIAGETLEIYYTAAGVETTKEQAAYSLSFAITDYDKKEASVKIGKKPTKQATLNLPTTVEFNGVEYTITLIPANAFHTCYHFVGDLVIPATVKRIENGAFQQCFADSGEKLGTLTLNENLTYIGNSAFLSSRFKGDLVVPSSVEYVGNYAFNNSGMDGTLTINCNVTNRDGFNGSKFTKLVVSEGVTSVGFYRAFAGMKSLKEVTLPSTLKEIGNEAFYEATAINKVYSSAFEAPAINNNNAFDNVVKDNATLCVENYKNYKNGEWAEFANVYGEFVIQKEGYSLLVKVNDDNCSVQIKDTPKDSEKRKLEIPAEFDYFGTTKEITSIAANGFKSCNFYGEVVVPGTIKTVGNNAFNSCYKINRIVFENGVESIGSSTLGNMYALTYVEFPASLKTIGDKCFTGYGENHKIITIVSYATEVPVAETASSFQQYVADKATLYVFEDVVSKYKNATGWSRFKTIKPIEAKIGETYYLTLSSALSAAQSGDVITLMADVKAADANPVVIPTGVTLDINTHDITANIYGTVKTDGGVWTTVAVLGFNSRDMLGEGAIYNTTNATVVNLANEVNVVAGTIVLNPHPETEWWTLPGQSLSIATGAKFEIPAGVKFTVRENTHVVVEGTLVTDGTVYLQAGATVRAEAGLNIQTTVAGHVVYYNNGVYSVIEPQTIQLKAGWNWFSSYVETDLESLQAALETSGVQIKSDNDGYDLYYAGYGWGGNLNTIESSQMYMIQTSADHELVLSGELLENVEITLNPGWNWISFPMSANISVVDAFAGLQPNTNDQIKSYDDGYASYYAGFGWGGLLNTLKPGQGYMYYSSSETPVTFTYSPSMSKSEAKANVTTEGNYWIPNAAQFANNMTMTAVLDVENINYEVAAFVNGECRGSARPIYVEALDAYMLFLTIHGEEVEEMTFKYYDIDTDTEYTLSDRINYSNNAILGSLKEPYMFTRGTTGIGEAELSQLNIYPNPTTTAAEINLNATFDKVEVFNALGVKVAEYSNVDSIDALETAGIYVIRATNNSVISHCRLVVK